MGTAGMRLASSILAIYLVSSFQFEGVDDLLAVAHLTDETFLGAQLQRKREQREQMKRKNILCSWDHEVKSLFQR